MPRCEGRSTGPGQVTPCPDNKNDASVRFGQGELFLCDACAEFRFPSSGSRPRTVVPSASTYQLRPAAATRVSTAKNAIESVDNAGCVGKKQNDDSEKVSVIVSELLAYVSFYRNKGNGHNLQSVVLSHFSPGGIAEAKRMLAGLFKGQLVDSSLHTERRSSTVRPAHEAELEDILEAMDLLDMRHMLAQHQFVAANLDILPKYGPEELNLGTVVDKQVKAEATIERLAADLDEVKAVTCNSNYGVHLDTSMKRVDDMVKTLGKQIEEFQAAVGNCAGQVHVLRQSGHTVVSDERSTDRSMNLVVFGIAEDREAAGWRRKVDDVLQFAAGRSVDIMDTFRIGRYAAGKVRPILVKLRAVWDRRIILSNCFKLKNYGDRVFISPDEAPDVRRRRVFDRLKMKAEQNGHSVAVVDNDVLVVNDVRVYSMRTGPVRNG